MKMRKLAVLLLAGCLVMGNTGIVIAAETETGAGGQNQEVVAEEKKEAELSEENLEELSDFTEEDDKETNSQQTKESDKVGKNNIAVQMETKAVEANTLEQVYVSSTGNDENGAGTQESPVATLAKAVEVAKDGATVYVMSDLTMTKSARYYGKNLTIKSGEGGPYTLTRGENFEQIQDNARSTYNPAMIEVDSTEGPNTASLTLYNIVLDDNAVHSGEYFIQAASDGDGKTDFGNLTGENAIRNASIVQDAIIATYNGGGSITLGEGAVLKNYGGMSAIRLADGKLIMKSGSSICDDQIIDRSKGTRITGADTGLYGPAGAVWMQGGTLQMDQGAYIGGISKETMMYGRAIYDEAGYAEINGTIQNLKGDLDMWQGESGVAIHTRGDGQAVLGSTGVIDTITGDHSGYRGAIMTNGDRNEGADNEGEGYDFTAEPGSVIKNVTGFPAVFSNFGNELLNGTIENCSNDYIIGGFANVTTIGEKGVLQNNICSGGAANAVVYTSNASDIYMNGTMKDNKVSYGFYIINQSGGGAYLEINDGALIQGTGSSTGVYINASESKCVMNGGTITGFGTGVYCRGKVDRDATFVMNDGVIAGNTSQGINFAAISGSQSNVDLNGGTIENNGENYEVYMFNGNSEDAYERVKLNSGVVKGNMTVNVSFGKIILDEDYADVQLGNAKAEAKNEIKNQMSKVHADWTSAGGNGIWIKPSTKEYHIVVDPSTNPKQTGLFVVYLPLKEDGTPQDGAQICIKEVENKDLVDITLDNLTAGTSYAVMLFNNTEYTLAPDDVTIYSGGGQGDERYDNGGLPMLTISDSIDLKWSGDLESLTVNGEERTATEEESLLDQLVSLLEVTYTDENGKKITEDSEPGEYVATLTLKDGYNPEDIQVNGNEINLDGEGSLIVRYTSNMDGATEGTITYSLLAEEPVQPVEHAEAIAKTRTFGSTEFKPEFYLNDDEGHSLENIDGVQLLDDELLADQGDGRQELMEKKAAEYLGDPGEGQVYCYDFHYLDLVDAYNGNAWVSAEYGTTVYLPYPEGVTKDAAERLGVKILHYKDLHREYGISGQTEVEEAIASGELETMEAEFTDAGIKFDTERAGFSPFAVVWQTAAYTITASAGEGGAISPSGKVVVGEGTDKSFVITPDDGYSVAEIKVDGQAEKLADIVGENGIGTYTFKDVTADHTIEVTFKNDSTTPGKPGESESDQDNIAGKGQDNSGQKQAVKTGDTTNIMLYFILMGGAVCVVIGTLAWRKIRK